MAPVAARLAEAPRSTVPLIKDWSARRVACGASSPRRGAARKLPLQQGEKKNDDPLARKMAKLCDVYVNGRVRHRHRPRATDARHRQARNCRCAGPLLARRVDASARRSRIRRGRWSPIVGGEVPPSSRAQALAASRCAHRRRGIANTFCPAAHGHVGSRWSRRTSWARRRRSSMRPRARAGAVDAVCAKAVLGHATGR